MGWPDLATRAEFSLVIVLRILKNTKREKRALWRRKQLLEAGLGTNRSGEQFQDETCFDSLAMMKTMASDSSLCTAHV